MLDYLGENLRLVLPHKTKIKTVKDQFRLVKCININQCNQPFCTLSNFRRLVMCLSNALLYCVTT